MAHCNACGSHVTPDFARVFGSNDDEVYACPDCATMVEIVDWGAAGRPVRA